MPEGPSILNLPPVPPADASMVEVHAYLLEVDKFLQTLVVGTFADTQSAESGLGTVNASLETAVRDFDEVTRGIASDVGTVVETLNKTPDAAGQYTAVKTLAGEVSSVVLTLGKDAKDPGQYSAVKQTAQGIDSVVAKLESQYNTPDQYTSIRQAASDITSIATTLGKDASDPTQFSSVKQTSDSIASVVSTLNAGIDELTQYSAIRQLKDEITSVVSYQETIDTTYEVHETVIEDHETRIVQTEDSILLKASQTDFNALGQRVTAAEGSILTQAGQIALKVEKSAYDTLAGVVDTHTATLTQHATDIALKVDTSTYNALGERVTTAEGKIDVNTSAITTKVSQTDFNALSGTVGTHTTEISQNATAIGLRLIESELKDKVVAAINLSSDGVTIQGKKIVLDGDTDVLGTFNVDGTLNIKGKSISQAAINIKHAVVDSVLLTPPEGTQTIVSVATDTATWNVLTVTPFDDTYRGLVVYHTATPMEGLLGGYEIQLGDNGTDWGPRISNLHYIADQYLFLPDNTMINFGHLFVQNDLVCFGYKNRTFGGPTTLWIRFRRMSVQV